LPVRGHAPRYGRSLSQNGPLRVGCEACHDPGSLYIDPQVMARRESFLAHGGVVPDATTCRRCHRNPDRFDFDEWWAKIDHARRAQHATGSSPDKGD